MREIKFRAWDKINKAMVKIARLDIVDGMAYTHLFNSSPLDFWNDVILEQFTGLYDKNGVEIYEGNVVEILDNLGGMGEVELTYKVYWNDELCQFLLNGINNNNHNIPLYKFDCEVIGNIHEKESDNDK